MRRALLTLALVPAVLAAGCSMIGGTAGTGGTLEGVRWVLKSYQSNGSATPVPAGVTADAQFKAGSVAGSGGCNHFTATYTVDGAKLTISQPASTLMACVGPGGDVESAYFAALPTAASFTATATALTIFNSAGAAILTYEAGPANPLVGEWDVTGFNNGKQAVVSPAAGSEMTATFTADGQLSGSDGCNAYNGTYTLEGEKLSIGPLASTKKACAEELMVQGSQFLTALQDATGIRTGGPSITLLAPDGSNAVILSPKA